MVQKHARFIIILLLVALVGVGSFAAIRINTASAATDPSRPDLALAPAAPAAQVPLLFIEKSRLINLRASSTPMMVVGSGFSPNQEVRLVISQADGSLSDVGSVTDPAEIKADETGVWAASLDIAKGRYLNTKIAKAGDVMIVRATDASYNILATSAIAVYDAKADYKKWPGYAKAIIPEPKPAATTPAKK